MLKKYFIFILFTFLFADSNPNISNRYYVQNGKLDASLGINADNLMLIQLDVINDSLFALADAAVTNLELLAGPASYHRIITENQYERLSLVISEDYLYILDDNYNRPSSSRDYWIHTIHGDNYYGSSGEIGNTCLCLNTDGCVVVGFNDSWYNPLDYYGEAWWNFQPPEFDNVTEVRVYVQGAQCDNIPLWSETNLSIKDNNCSSNGSFQATLSLDYTLNGPYVIPPDQLDNIWCEGNLQPIVGSEDNYSVDFVRMEFYYSCDIPNGIDSFEASNADFCDYVDLSWEVDPSAESYYLYRDGELLNQFTQEINQYLDYQAESGAQHQYCIYSSNECGQTEGTCSNGRRKEVPQSVENMYASDGDSSEFIVIYWDAIPGDIVYKLYIDNVQLAFMSNYQDLYYEDQFVDSQESYEYCVEAINDCGSSVWSCDSGFIGIGQIGDVNLDSTLDILDVILLLNYILEIEFPNQDQLWLSDINSDLVLNILDIIALVNIILD